MQYLDRIAKILRTIPKTIFDLKVPRDRARVPTLATTNFITNKEQGDWAERLITTAINNLSNNHIAVKYGKSDDIIAGDEGWAKFYENFQDELDTIGKRPDILIFKKSDYEKKYGSDISKLPHKDIDKYVRKAIAGIEIRSSSFLIEKYDFFMKNRLSQYTKIALDNRDIILKNFRDLLQDEKRKKYIDLLKFLNKDNLAITDFKIPGWGANERLIELNSYLKVIKNSIKEIQKRDFLSITPKVEDLKVIYKWIETYNVPHYYFQVFFDKVYGISFEQILNIISDPDNEGPLFSIEQDEKNQNKTTIKIRSTSGIEIGNKVDEPEHKSVRKELARGRLLFYVTFQGGLAYLNVGNLKKMLNIKHKDF